MLQLERPWNSFTPNKQRWLVYKHMLMLRDGATITTIRTSIASHHHVEVEFSWVEQTLNQFRACGMVRSIRSGGVPFWRPTEKRSNQLAPPPMAKQTTPGIGTTLAADAENCLRGAQRH